MNKTTIQTLTRSRFGLRWKITLTFVFLAAVLGAGSIYQVWRAGAESAQTRLNRQLADSGQQALDGVVRAEQDLLEVQRLVANTDGVAEALASGDAETLRALVLPVVVNADVDVVSLLDSEAASVLAVRRRPDVATGTYDTLRGEAFYAEWPFVQQALAPPGASGGKFAGLHALRSEDRELHVFMVSGPLEDELGRQVGVVVAGRYLDNILVRLATESGANVSAYDLAAGELLGTTLESAGRDPLPLDRQLMAGALFPDQAQQPVRSLSVAGVPYQELVLRFEARAGSDLLGFLGFSLLDLGAAGAEIGPSSAGVPATSLLFAVLGVALAILLGLLVSDPLARQAATLRAALDALARDDPSAVWIEGGGDELGQAASLNLVAVARSDGSGPGAPPTPKPNGQGLTSLSTPAPPVRSTKATVLYAEILGFRPFLDGEADSGAELESIEGLLGKLAAVIRAHGGEIVRLEWDHCLAVFGIAPRPLPAPVGALQAVHAGVSILELIEGASLRRMLAGNGGFAVGVGLATGRVGSAPPPLNGRPGVAVTGNPVEAAQRVGELTRRIDAGGLLLPEATLIALGAAQGQFKVEEFGQLSLPGGGRATAIYRVGERTAPLIEFQALERSPS